MIPLIIEIHLFPVFQNNDFIRPSLYNNSSTYISLSRNIFQFFPYFNYNDCFSIHKKLVIVRFLPSNDQEIKDNINTMPIGCNIRPPYEEASLENCNKLFSVDPNNSYQESAGLQEAN